MSNKTVWWVIVLGTIAIAGIISLQLYWFIKALDIKEQELQRNVTIALYNTSRHLANHQRIPLPATGLIKTISPTYYQVRLNSAIDPRDLEKYLLSELESVGIQEDFEYAIHNSITDEIVFVKHIIYNKGERIIEPRKDRKNPSVLSNKNNLNYFTFRFPSRDSFVMRELQTSVITSSILLMTVIFFAYAMYVILRQQRMSQLQKDFINNMTHEFKTPISTIKIAAESFKHNPDIMQNERLKKYVHIITEQNERLNAQVEKVLQLARIEKDQFKLNKEKINLHEYILATLESVEVKLQEVKGQYETQLHAQQYWIMADALHLTNVLHNIYDNAIKYKRDVPKIQIATEDVGSQIRLSITDFGKGIRKEDIPKLFNKFYRVPTGDVHDVKGFGLGLYYVKSICDAHGWLIEIESEINTFTRVCIFMNGNRT